MKWRELNVKESEALYNEYIEYRQRGKEWDKCPDDYLSLKADIEKAFADVLQDMDIGPEDIQKKAGNYAYRTDLYFGLKLYRILNEKYGMMVRHASTAGIWRYISMVVAPEVIELRYGLEHPDRFWKKAKRLWFRVLWWYIYLSWQGSEKKTADILQNNTTDEILQLVDRAGKGGYRVDLYREIMKNNAKQNQNEWKKKQMFRKIMVLNTARLQVIEPALVDGGEQKYVRDLCEYFREGKE